MENKVTVEQMKAIFQDIIEPVTLDIDKEMEQLKIPEEKDFLNF